jgi:hypothetical protein
MYVQIAGLVLEVRSGVQGTPPNKHSCVTSHWRPCRTKHGRSQSQQGYLVVLGQRLKVQGFHICDEHKVVKGSGTPRVWMYKIRHGKPVESYIRTDHPMTLTTSNTPRRGRIQWLVFRNLSLLVEVSSRSFPFQDFIMNFAVLDRQTHGDERQCEHGSR